MFRDITSKSKSIKSSLEDLKDISDLMFQDNEKTISKKQKELEEVIYSRDTKIPLLGFLCSSTNFHACFYHFKNCDTFFQWLKVA